MKKIKEKLTQEESRLERTDEHDRENAEAVEQYNRDNI